MSKRRYVFNLLSAAELKARSEVPLAANITVVDDTIDYIDCVYIDMDLVKDILGVAIDTELYDLCRHANVNRWSAFCPVVRSLTGSGWTKDISNGLPTEGSLEEFAGYNHGALVPGWQTGGEASAEADIWINSGSKATVSAPICIGEIDWSVFDAEWVVMLIFDETDAIVGWGKTDIATVANNFTLAGETDNTLTLNKNWYGRLLICDNAALADHDDVVSALICRVPNTTTFDIKIKIKEASKLTVNANGLTVESAGFNLSAGTCGFTKFYHATNSYSRVLVQAKLLNWLGEQVGSTITMHDGAYTSPDEEFPNVTASAKPNGDPVAAYGYEFVIDFFLTT
jgi:hypothetical protein